jgi:hypothetical protein
MNDISYHYEQISHHMEKSLNNIGIITIQALHNSYE